MLPAIEPLHINPTNTSLPRGTHHQPLQTPISQKPRAFMFLMFIGFSGTIIAIILFSFTHPTTVGCIL